MPLWIDTHCHLDAREFAQDVDAVRQRARERGVGQIVIPAVDVHNFAAVRGLAHRHGDSYALGIHPLCSPGAGAADLQALECAGLDQLYRFGAARAVATPRSLPRLRLGERLGAGEGCGGLGRCGLLGCGLDGSGGQRGGLRWGGGLGDA